MKTTEKKIEKALVVSTEKGMFFGYGDPEDAKSGTIRLVRARCAVYWSQDVKGFMGLGATGPTKNCRISPEVPAWTVLGVTGCIEASAEAEKAWAAGPWA